MFAPRRRVGAGSNRNNLGLVLLAIQLVQFGVDRVPVVTLTTILLNVGKLSSLWCLVFIALLSGTNIIY